MRPASLRMRLFIAANLSVLAAMAVAWVGLDLLFQRHIIQREAGLLIHRGEALASDLAQDHSGNIIVDGQQTDTRFNKIASGLYWQVTGLGLSQHSPSLWDQTLPMPVHRDANEWHRRFIKGPYKERLLIVEREVHFDAGKPILIQVAQDDRDMRRASIEFGWELGVSLAVLWLALAVATYIYVPIALRPLIHLRRDLERLRLSPRARLELDYLTEISPLTSAVNGLADARENDLVRARKRAGDLAHSLKTPLSVMSAQSRKARAAGATEAADGLDKAITAVNAALEAELSRARSAAARAAVYGKAESQPLTVIEGLIAVIERTERGEELAFDNAIASESRIPVASEDLSEILGALIENAARYAKSLVRMTDHATESTVGLTVEDDGPGLPPELHEAAMRRGLRLDEAGTGHGLGLAIVRELVEATEGQVAFGRSDLGGLGVTLTWLREPRPYPLPQSKS